MTSIYAHPLDGGPALLAPPDPEAAERAAAATALARVAGTDAEGLRIAYMALGLIPDPEHKATRWTRD